MNIKRRNSRRARDECVRSRVRVLLRSQHLQQQPL